MRVIKLVAQNFKRIRAVDITPGENVVKITGRNAQGKSSVLDAILAALAGGRSSAQPDMPIRKGAKESSVYVDLGDLKVTRTWKEGPEGKVPTTLVLENGDGARFPQPQQRLDKMIGELSFDPLAFVHMKPREQYDALAKNVEGVNLDEVAALNKGDFEKRTDVNRRAKEARAAASVIVVPEVIPEKVDTAALVAQLSGATAREGEIAAHNRRAAELRKRLDDAGARGKANADERVRLANRIIELEAEFRTIEAEADQLAAEVDAFPLPPARIDTAAVAAQLNEAQAANQKVDEILKNVERRGTMEKLAASLEAESEQLTARIDARNKQKDDAIANAKMPVEGIGFGDGEILLNGVPFSQASSAEQLRTSVAIAAAMNPKLRVIHVRDGSLLDDDSMAWLAEYAKANDLQVWVEVVGTDGNDGVLIEDGQVVTPAKGEAA